jgi:hypothetical protein
VRGPFLALACLLGLAALVFTAPAGAGKVLSMRQATDVTKGVAKRDCRRDPNCERSDAANCRRLAPRRVSCVASYVGSDRDGAYQCERLVLVRLRDDGGLRHAAGNRSCYDV